MIKIGDTVEANKAAIKRKQLKNRRQCQKVYFILTWDTCRNQRKLNEGVTEKKQTNQVHMTTIVLKNNAQGAFSMEEDILHNVRAWLRLSYLTIPLPLYRE